MTRRLFVAIDLPPPVRWRLARLLPDPPRGARPVPAGRLHLTLHFLGEVADAPRAALPAALAHVPWESFGITIRGTGVFPPRGRPTVLWAGVADSAPLRALHAAVGGAVESCGVEIERRPYVPHVTLARLTPAVPRAWTLRFLDAFSDLGIEDVPVAAFTLYESRTRDGSTEHVAEATFPPARPDHGADDGRPLARR